MSQKDFILWRDLADVVLDARAPLILAIRDWITRAKAKRTTTTQTNENDKLVVAFDTSNRGYFKTVKDQLSEHGCIVVDRHDPLATPEVLHLVYCNTTAETLSSAASLLRARIATKDNMALFLDNPRGIRELSEQGLSGVDYVCSAEIYDGMFARVRQLACEGNSFAEIQRIFDHPETTQ